ncbi:hypothetical protein [Variovorax sp. W2I14]|uniref:hypothetical protein n=1 Tax=Variovorax sp. W2I14 TaxID=3042290 RepID=UPI003D233487
MENHNQTTFDEELTRIEAQLRKKVEFKNSFEHEEVQQSEQATVGAVDHKNGMSERPTTIFGKKIDATRLSDPVPTAIVNDSSSQPFVEEVPIQATSLPNDNNELLAPSVVDGLSQEDLHKLKSESRAAFSSGVAEVALTPEANLITRADGKRMIVIDFGKNLSPAEIGSFGINRDISKSLKNPEDGIRDFFNVSYDEESRLRVIDKENYLNLPLTGDPSAALTRLSEYEYKNKFNTTSLRNLHDATHTNMVKAHERERQESRNDPEVLKRHKIEVALWTYREQAQLSPEKDSKVHNFNALMKLHEALKIEQKGGRTVHPARRVSFEKEAEKFAAEPSPNRINVVANKINPTRAQA